MGDLLMRRTAAASIVLLMATGAAAQDAQPPNERGSVLAPVTLVEYCRYDSDACARLEIVINSALASLPADRVRFVFRHLPANATPEQSMRYRAALAAGAQGAFWALHDTLLANYARGSRDDVLAMAQQLGLDTGRLAADMNLPAVAAAVEHDIDTAKADGVTSVPALLVNGRPIALDQARDQRAALLQALADRPSR